jgi:hypothetical protein
MPFNIYVKVCCWKMPLVSSRINYRNPPLFRMDRQEVGWGGTNRIYLAEGWDRCWVRVNVVMNLRVHKMQGIS